MPVPTSLVLLLYGQRSRKLKASLKKTTVCTPVSPRKVEAHHTLGFPSYIGSLMTSALRPIGPGFIGPGSPMHL